MYFQKKGREVTIFLQTNFPQSTEIHMSSECFADVSARCVTARAGGDCVAKRHVSAAEPHGKLDNTQF